MSKGIFVTATGTDIGKTFISGLLVKKMRDYGLNCGYFKPALSGAVKEPDGTLTPGDAKFVLETAEIKRHPKEVVSYIFEEAVSPHLAAQRQSEEIKIAKIRKDFEEASKKYDYLLIEGAGGITCPLRLENGEKYLLKDLIKEFNTGIIIIADAGLGTINSTLLTVEYANNNGIKIEGIILNNFRPDSFMHQDNLKQVEYLTGIKVVATVEKEQKDITLLKDLFKE